MRPTANGMKPQNSINLFSILLMEQHIAWECFTKDEKKAAAWFKKVSATESESMHQNGDATRLALARAFFVVDEVAPLMKKLGARQFRFISLLFFQKTIAIVPMNIV